MIVTIVDQKQTEGVGASIPRPTIFSQMLGANNAIEIVTSQGAVTITELSDGALILSAHPMDRLAIILRV